ncbi:LOW QUALITY PROTEIN: hypothetical protein U9M48_028381 [Paspalum notatum var. saurae]|uniref:Tf2-1-like SH3-like domain-containing protein n=1 Tax=Paspalum notatum var. saurae TaxID=547442 RepID=A0AAQ3TWQ0_PASNO
MTLAYSIHPGSTKMYYDPKERFRWYGMKRSLAEYVAVCDTVAESRRASRPGGSVAAVKDSRMEMGTDKHGFHCLPKTRRGHDSIRVVVDYPTKVAHFIPVRTTYPGAKLANHATLCEFSYNNSYQAGLKRPPFEALYGESAGPHCSESTGEKQVFGLDIIKDAEEQVKIVRENPRVARSRRKSYAYKRRRDLTFEVNDFVYPKVSPMRGIHRFNIKGKLAPVYIGPFKVLEKKGVVAYKLELPPGLTGVHDKCLRVPEEEAPPEGLDVREDLTYTEHPKKILDTQKELPGTRGSKCASAVEASHEARLLGKEKKR